MTVQDTTTPAAAPATDEPQPGYKRIHVPAHSFDIPIEPSPLVDRIWSGTSGKIAEFDSFACELYADIAQLAAQSGASVDNSNDGNESDLTSAYSAAARVVAFSSAINDLRCAARHLRDVRIALSPYVSNSKLQRGY